MRLLAWGLFIPLCMGLPLEGQGPPAQSSIATSYDVSTVKPAAAGQQGMSINWRGNALEAKNVTVQWLLTNAFHARMDQISGFPDWAKSKHFDIEAKLTDVDPAAADKLTADQHRALLRALLAERFGLKFHVEEKQMPIYDLVPGKSGLKLTAALNPGDKGKEWHEMCSGCTNWGENNAKAHDIDMSLFAEMLAAQLGKSVRDETGYSGKIDVDIKWAPDVSTHAPTDEEAALPPLPQALEKELGLRLVATRGPVKMYVVDGLVEPSGN